MFTQKPGIIELNSTLTALRPIISKNTNVWDGNVNNRSSENSSYRAPTTTAPKIRFIDDKIFSRLEDLIRSADDHFPTPPPIVIKVDADLVTNETLDRLVP